MPFRRVEDNVRSSSFVLLDSISILSNLIGKWAFCWSGVCEIHIPDSVEELCDKCFCQCYSLLRVIFGESSSLKVIGWAAFRGSGIVEIHIPDGVEKLCGWCFSDCKNLSRVTFGESSSLKLIGKKAFFGSGVVEIHVPDGIERVLMERDKPVFAMWYQAANTNFA